MLAFPKGLFTIQGGVFAGCTGRFSTTNLACNFATKGHPNPKPVPQATSPEAQAHIGPRSTNSSARFPFSR